MPISLRRTAMRRAAVPVSFAVMVGGALTATVVGFTAGPVSAESNLGRQSGPAAPSTASAPTHERVRVPNVVGMTQLQAQCALDETGLRWRYRGDHRVHSTPIADCSSVVMPDPKVISQRPKAGKHVRPQRVIVLDDECLKRVRDGDGPCF